MSFKKLLILVAVLAVLAGAAYVTRTRGPAGEADAPAIGDAVLPDLDVNLAQAITIAGADGTSRLSRVEGTWVVESLYDYPADFSRIRQQLTSLLNLKVGQIMRADETTRAETGLNEEAAVVTLLGADNNELAVLRVGAARTPQAPAGGFGGYPDGQYVAVDDDYIVVVTTSLRGFSATPSEWIDRQLLEVDANEIASIAVDNGDESYVILNDTNQVMTLEGLGEDETFEAASAGQLKRALTYLSCQSVADPSLSDETMGLEQPATHSITLRDGRSYSVALGAPTEDARYARLSIQGDEERDPLQAWTYLIPTYAADSMTASRDTLVKPVEAEQTDGETEPEAPGAPDVPGTAETSPGDG